MNSVLGGVVDAVAVLAVGAVVLGPHRCLSLALFALVAVSVACGPTAQASHSHSPMAAIRTVASKRTASLSNRVATARLRLSRLIPHSTACRAL